jgi:hypothetical protein
MTKIAKWLPFAIILAALLPHGTRANTYTAASCSVSDIQAQVSIANDGDTVLVSGGGTATWSTALIITKGITLNGQGCTIVLDVPSGGHLVVTADSVANTFITGFSFNNGSAVSGVCAIDFNTTLTPLTMPYRFYSNTFVDNGMQGSQIVFLCHHGLGPGLIDHNSFTVNHGADEIIHNVGGGSPTDTTGWTTDVIPGGPNMLFVETNTFTYNAKTSPANSGQPEWYFNGTSAIENYYGARTVWRYNQMSMIQIDVHGGACGSTEYGRWWEIYNNNWNFPDAPVGGKSDSQGTTTVFRGGTGVSFNNTVTNASNNVGGGGQELTIDCDSSGTYPIMDQVGRGILQNQNPAFFWNNPSGSYQPYVQSTDHIQLGTALVDAANCSANPGNRCDAVNTPTQPSAMLRCQSAADVSAGCPVSYTYNPYIYPHPLVNGSGSSVAPPTNLTATIN